MLKFSNTAKNAALAALLGAGLAGSAAVMLTPVVAHAQYYYSDWDDHYYYDRDWDDGYRGWVGIGVPGFGIGFYTHPYRHYYAPYCSRYDFDHGYC